MGTLRGFDDYVNMVLEDVTELYARDSEPLAGSGAGGWVGLTLDSIALI